MDAEAAQSYAAAVERLDGSSPATGRCRWPASATRSWRVADLLESSRGCAGPWPTRPGRARTAPSLLDSVLRGKVGEDTEALLRLLVAGHWSAPADLLDAVERLGVEALLASADSAGELTEVEDELFRFGQVVRRQPRARVGTGPPRAPATQRAELVARLLEGKASPATVRLVDLAVSGFGGRNFASALSRLVELAAERRDRQVAYVTVAKPLTDDEESRLSAGCAEIYGRQVSLKVGGRTRRSCGGVQCPHRGRPATTARCCAG